MPPDTPIAPPQFGARPAATEDSTSALYRAALGPIGADYYLPVFNAFDGTERVRPRWNWAAGLLTLNWLLWRHLWKDAIYYSGAVVAAVLLVFGIGSLVFQFSATVQWVLLGLLGMASVLLPGFFGNSVLHADCRRRMTTALRASDTEREACGILQLQASTRRQLGLLAGANALVWVLVGVAALQWAELGASASAKAPPVEPKPSASGVVSAPILPAPSAAPAFVASAAAPVLPAVSSPTAVPTPGSTTAASAIAASAAAAPPQPAASAVVKTATPAAASSRATQGRVPAPVAKADAPKSTASSPKPAEKFAKKSAEKSGQFLINVGLFAVESNAEKAYAQLRAAGLPATSQSFGTSKGPRTRVRVGPFATRAEAQAAVEKIKAIPLDAVIISQ